MGTALLLVGDLGQGWGSFQAFHLALPNIMALTPQVRRPVRAFSLLLSAAIPIRSSGMGGPTHGSLTWSPIPFVTWRPYAPTLIAFWSRCQCRLRPCIQSPPGVGVSLPSVKFFAEGLRTSIVLACRGVLLKGPRAGRGIRFPIMAADLAFHSLGLLGFYKSSNLASCPVSILRSTRLSDASPSIPTPGPWVPFLLALGLGLSLGLHLSRVLGTWPCCG